jgi:nucleoside phosphorylase
MSIHKGRPQRPESRCHFEVAILCALSHGADAVDALFDHHWETPYDKAPSDPNTYSTGVVGSHNVVLAYMPGMGEANVTVVASNCRSSFPNIRLAVVVGVCGVVPFDSVGNEMVLGDVIISDRVVQHDFGWEFPERFVQINTLHDSLGRPNTEIRSLLDKLKAIRHQKALHAKIMGYLEATRAQSNLAAEYPGTAHDKLFETTYRHVGDGLSCEECGCDGPLVPRRRLEQDNPPPTIHFGLIASGDTMMKSGEDRDRIARQNDAVGFEMEIVRVWDIFPCVLIKGVCDYADGHKSKRWQRYAAVTAAACMKAFLCSWVPSLPSYSGM